MAARVGTSIRVLGLLVPALLTGGGDVLGQSVQTAAPRPNIVVIYMDDFSPRAADLWSDESRTPALARFVHQGVSLNASGSTPLCCPARANVLTGRYGHNNGVTRNDIRGFDPRSTVAVKLQQAGYHTAFVGKFLNRLADRAPTRRHVLRYALGWNAFDVIWENQGRFYDYRLWTRARTRSHGHHAGDHSSHVMGVRAARHIRNAPRDRPVFMIVSLFDGHTPRLPMPRFDDHPACRDLDPWGGPSFNESDVSDKPGYVRGLRHLGRDHYPLQVRCEEVMTVDRVTRRVRAALKRTGRLDDTLFIFTADNGWLMGEHRLADKTYPYATPIPMYAMWPRAWGNERRLITEPVSNVDLARTFCHLGGCRMPRSDGMNLAPLLDGTVDQLDRTFIYEEMLHPGPNGGGRPAWYGIRTTLGYSDTLWVYTEYSTGEKELYDLTADPYQLENLARRNAYSGVRADLRRMLWNGVIEPDEVRFSRLPLT